MGRADNYKRPWYSKGHMGRADNKEEGPCSLQSFIDLRRGGGSMALSRAVMGEGSVSCMWLSLHY